MSRIKVPSPAMAISLLALFVALGGTGYAAVKINGKNIKAKTIAGTKLKNKTITGAKLKSNGVSGRQVHEQTVRGAHFSDSPQALKSPLQLLRRGIRGVSEVAFGLLPRTDRIE